MMGFAGDAAASARPGDAARPSTPREAAQPLGRVVTRHPIITLLVGAAVLLTIAIPALSLRLGLPDAGRRARGLRRPPGLRACSPTGFGPGFNGPLVVLVDAADDPAALPDAVGAVVAQVSALPDVAYAAPVAAPGASEGADAALVVVIPTGAPNAEETARPGARHPRRAARTSRPPPAPSSGSPARPPRTSTSPRSSPTALPLFLLIVVGLAFVLLLVAFRSLLVPLTAVLGFLLTIAATFGATVAVYQWGWLSGIFGVDSARPAAQLPADPAGRRLFGLAMDYQVFLVSRMREEHVHGADAARRRSGLGFAHGARVVLAAAIIMISVFAGFVFGGRHASSARSPSRWRSASCSTRSSSG